MKKPKKVKSPTPSIKALRELFKAGGLEHYKDVEDIPITLILAAVNALPVLLNIAERAKEWERITRGHAPTFSGECLTDVLLWIDP